MKLWRLVISNLSSALLAVFLAVVVWVVAVYEKAPPRTDVFPDAIPVKIVNVPPGLTISNTTESQARIRIRALASAWEELTQESFEATLDLDGLQAGRHELPVQVETQQKDVEVLAIDPARIPVNLEELSERRIRVRVKVLDEESIPLGYISGIPVVAPEQITISGPKTTAALVTEALLEVSLRNARDTVVKQDTPLLLDASGNRVQGLAISPPTVTVSVSVERQVGYRDVTVRATTTGSPAPGYWVSNISAEPALVTVYGQPGVINGLPGFLDTEAIDVTGAQSDIIRRAPLALPEGVLVLGEGAGREGILVQISVQPLLGGQTINRQLTVQNLRFGLTAAPSPTSVDVILSGPLPALQELQPDDVEVVLDLFGLNRGKHKVTPKVTLPEGKGLAVKSIVPDIVEVTVE